MLSIIRIAVAAALLGSAAATLAYEPQRDAAAEAQDQASRPTHPQRRAAQGDRLICRTVDVAGPGNAMPMVCLPAAEWERPGQ